MYRYFIHVCLCTLRSQEGNVVSLSSFCQYKVVPADSVLCVFSELMGTDVRGVLLFVWIVLFKELVVTSSMGTNVHGVLIVDGYLYSVVFQILQYCIAT